MAFWQPALTAFFTRKQQGIQQISIVIRIKKMVVADRETVSVLGNNWVNLCCRNIARWDVDAIELLSKYGLTRQLENWQKVGRSKRRRVSKQ